MTRLPPPPTALELLQHRAIQYLLVLAQWNPDVGYVLLDTEAHARLCEAEANFLKEETAVVKRRREETRWHGEPQVVVLRGLLEGRAK